MIETADYTIKIFYFEEWFQADSKIKIPVIDSDKFFGGLELIRLLDGEHKEIVYKALKHSNEECLKLEQAKRKEYRKIADRTIEEGVIPIF